MHIPAASLKKTSAGPRWTALLCLVLAACGGELPLEEERGLVASEAALTTVRVRLMAANTSSGNYQSYDPGHGIRIFQGTKPDIVMIQEFNYGDNSATALRQFVDTAFGTNFQYSREGGAQIPNGVISRWPIIASGEWDDPYVTNRDFAWARIDIPGPKDLWVVSVHLLTSDATTRNNEAKSLVQRIQANIPAGDFLAIGGDFNTNSRTESSFSTLSSVVTTSGAYPVDKNGNGNTNASRAKPYDHVLVDGDLLAYQTATVIGSSSFASGLVVDTRVYSPLSEISPALSGDSGATNMQHMAVIKDFLVPGDVTGTANVFLNEILANEPGSSTSGEFVELVNSGTASMDLSGWTLSDGTSVRHTFAAGMSLAAGKALVVYASSSGIPAGVTNVVVASTGTLSLGNSGDTVTLKNAGGTVVDTFTYTSTLASVDGVSMNRSPDASSTSTFVLHTTMTSLSSSPGKRATGAAF